MFLKQLKNLIRFLLVSNKKYVIYSESFFYKNFYIDFYLELKKLNNDIIIVTSDLKEYNYCLHNDYRTFYIGDSFVRILFFSLVNCENLIMTMPNIGINFAKSKFCKRYVYFFHSLASTHLIYTNKAFDNYDVILTNGDYQKKEICINEINKKINKKIIYNSGYFYLDYLKEKIFHDKIKKDTILFAPSWNYNQKNLFNDYAVIIINDLIKSNFKVILRPHPEIAKRNKKNLRNLIDLYSANDSFILDLKPSNISSMESSSAIITDNSTITMEFAIALNRPVFYINYASKIHNKYFEEINTKPIEDIFKKEIGINIEISNIAQLGKIIKKNLNIDNKSSISKFEKNLLANIGCSANKAANFLYNLNENR